MMEIKAAHHASHHAELLGSITTGQQRIPMSPPGRHWAAVSAELFVLTEFEIRTFIQLLCISEELTFPILLLGSQIFLK